MKSITLYVGFLLMAVTGYCQEFNYLRINGEPDILNDTLDVDVLVREKTGSSKGLLKKIDWSYLRALFTTDLTGHIPYTGAEEDIEIGDKHMIIGDYIVDPDYDSIAGLNIKGRINLVNDVGNNNVLVGVGSGKSITSGNDNTALGAYALNNNATGNANVSIGQGALYESQNTSYSTAVGYAAMFSATGNYNTGIGFSALNSTSSSNNTAVGASSMVYTTSGDANSAFGTGALLNNLTGSRNTAIGRNSLSKNIIGSRNISVGYQAGTFNTGSDNTMIGNSAMQNAYAGNANIWLGAITSNNLTMNASSGSYNTIIGTNVFLNGDELTNSNQIILADGQGNRILEANGTTQDVTFNGIATFKSSLKTDGDFEVTDTAKGIILKSPDGTRWRITVDDSGSLITTPQ